MSAITNKKTILTVSNLDKYFYKHGQNVKVLDDINFEIQEGDFFGVIGESGSGKSTVGKCLIRLYDSEGGTIVFDKKVINQKNISKNRKRWLCDNMQMIFQDPMSSLNQRKNVLSLVSEPLKINKSINITAKKTIDNALEINQFFRIKYTKQDYDLSSKYLVKFYEELISEYSKNIELLKKYKPKKYLDFTTYLSESGLVFDNFHSKFKQKLNLIIKFADEIKKLPAKNYSDFTTKKTNISESNYQDCKIAYENAKKLVKAPKSYWELEDKIESLKHDLNDFLDNEAQKKRENTIFFKSLIENFLTEIKVYTQRKLISSNLMKYLDHKLTVSIKNSSLNALKQIENLHFLARKDIYEYYGFILEYVKTKYKNLIIDVNDLDKLSNTIDNSIENNVDELTLTAIKQQYKTVFNRVNHTIDVIEKEDFLQNDEAINKWLKKLIHLSEDNQKIFANQRDQKKSEIHQLNNQLNEILFKYKNSNEKTKNIETAKIALADFEKAKIKKQEFYNEKYAEFQKDFLPKSLKQKKLITELTKKLNQLKTAYKIEANKYLQNIKKYLKDSNINDYNQNKKVLANEIQRKISNFALYDAEVETYLLEVFLFRKLRSTNKKILQLQAPQLKQVLIRDKVYQALDKVGLKREHSYRYPHEFSGGQRQRIVIARALISKPKLIIADEPISALDVSIQAQVVNIMKDLAKTEKITFLFIAHDLSMVKYVSNRLIIMHKGRIVEKGDTDEVYNNPIHPYTVSLMKASPELSKLHVDLASFKFDDNYDANYKINKMPEFIKVKSKSEHYVLATKAQFKKWTA